MAKQKENNKSESIDSQNRLNDALRKQQEILGQIGALENQSLENYADTLNLQQQLYTNAKLIATVGEQIDKLSQSDSDRAKVLTEQYSSQRDLLDELQSKYIDIVTNSNNIVEDSFEIVDLSKEHNRLAELLLDTELARDFLGEKEYNKQKELLQFIKDRLDSMNEINSTQQRANDLSKKFLSENTLMGGALQKTLGGIENLAHKFGGHGLIGHILGKKASKLIEETRDSIKKKITKAFQESGTAGVSAFSVAKMAAGSFAKYALPALGIAGVLGIFYAISHAIGHLDEELKEIGQLFTASREEADKIHHISLDIAKEMGVVGVNSMEVAKGIKEAQNSLNGLSLVPLLKQGNEEAKKLVEDTTILTEKFGLSADEVSNLHGLSVMTKKSMGELVKDSIKMGKGFLGTKASIMLISKLSPTMVMNFKKGGQELLKAAQKAKLLGIELDQVQDFGEGILDFETSLEKEMEARVLTGKNINFDLARQYALNNDIASLQEEMLNQLGSAAEFEKMNFLQRKSISEAFGMTVDQVSKLLIAQEKLKDLGISQSKLDALQAKNAEELRKESEKLGSGKLKDYVTQLAKEKEVATINERISDAMTKIKETLSSTLAPLLEQVHHFLDSAEGAEFIKGTVEGIKTIMYGLVSAGKALASGISYVNKLFGGTGVAVGIIGGLLATIATYFVGKALIVNGVKALTSSLTGASSAASNLAGGVQQIANASSGLGGAGGAGSQLASFGSGITPFAQNAVALGISLIAFAGALWITSKAFQEFAKLNWDEVLGGIGVMSALLGVAAVLTILGKVVMADGGVTATGLVALGASLVLFSASLLIAAKGLEILSKIKWKNFDGIFTALAKVAASFTLLGLASVPITLGSIALGVASVALGGFAASVNLLGKGLKSLSEIGDMSAAGKNIVNGLKELAKVPKALDIKAIEDSFDELEDALDELNFDDLIAFGDLAKAEMKKAGSNLVEGINSLVGINENINWSQLETTFDLLEDSLDELDFDDVKAFAELAKTDLSNVGSNINKGLESLSLVKATPDIQKNLLQVDKIFDWFEDALSELDYEDIKEFTSSSWESMTGFANKFKEFLTSLGSLPKNSGSIIGGFSWLMGMVSEAVNNIDPSIFETIGEMQVQNLTAFSSKFSNFIKTLETANSKAPSAISNLTSNIQLLNEAINKLNVDKLKELSQVRMEVAEPTGIVGFVNKLLFGKTANETTTAVSTPSGGIGVKNESNVKLDKMINLLEQLVSGLNQPTVIKIGDRTIETIGTNIQRSRESGVTRSGGRGIDLLAGTG
jgi:hypothetical protein